MSGPGPSIPPPSLLADTLLLDLELAWRERQEEAEVLEREGHLSIALALHVYSLEIRLKTMVCRHLKLDLLPAACKTHDLSILIIFTGLWGELTRADHAAIRRNWDILVAYSKKSLNESRYLPRNSLGFSDYPTLMTALQEPNDGVIAWLSKPR